MTETGEHRTEPAPDDPRKPDSPPDLRKPSWKLAFKGAVREFMDDQCTDLAAALTYYAVLAAAPATLALVSLLGFVGDPKAAIDSILTTLSDFLPEETLAIIQPLVEQLVGSTGAGLALVVGLVIALWSASGYVNAFGRAMNRVYEVEEGRPIWKLRPIMLLVTLVVVLLAALVVASLVLSGPVARAVGSAVGLGDVAITVWNIAKWPFALLLVVIVVALLYHLTPNVRQPKFRWISIGALVAIVVWAIASAAFGFYVANFGNYGSYGLLGTVIVFLLWLWITNLALLFGAELDAELERSRELQGGIAAEESIQLPPRDTRASDKKEAKRRDAIAEARAVRESAARDDGPPRS
ncbi:YihY/virulence factor BrkB family protein [Isoptericola sp. NEAU-Y5]|uniref:YihY/virulence factor BrkB family protein n=1 Tax=Isoptericola luteus TaxID=2879484 RepID=A0ABS7ZI80_9MICO|nr:YihY/virulence factor BrkB family protein [Isoptericola sp. NEAU-Y5]MCA5894217.1 YihY/virulence factor BrkB family protein [Isoptericola sp. NEAU-Y5]